MEGRVFLSKIISGGVPYKGSTHEDITCYNFTFFFESIDVPPNSSRDPKVGPRPKQWKKKKIGEHSLTRNTLGVGGRVRALGWDYNELISKSSR